jgi:hypothetical protein
MLPKTGKRFPKSGVKRLESRHFAIEIGKALQRELGGTHQTVKTIMRWTCASERTIKNWLDGSHGPSSEHLIAGHTYAVSSGWRNQRQLLVSSISERMVSGGRATSCSMTRAAMRPTPLVLRRLWRNAYSSR